MNTAAQDGYSLQELPQELRRSPPRAVALTVHGKVVVVIAIVLVIAALVSGVLLYLGAARDAVSREQLKNGSVPVQAEVVQISTTRGKDARRIIRYRYDVSEKTYQGTVRVPLRQLRDLHVGSPLPVVYFGVRPEVSWLPGHEPRGIPWLLVPLVPAAFLFTAALIALHLHRDRQLLAEGRPAVARVISSKRVLGNRSAHYRIEYEFKLLSGTVRTGRVDSAMKPPAAGAPMVILYAPDDPNRRARYPFSLVKVDIPR
jgi:hypothetical protein